MAARGRTLFTSPLLRVSEFTCDTPRSGCGCEMCDGRSSLTVVRRGVHAFHARGAVALAAPGTAILYRGGDSYRLSHPFHRDVADLSTCIEFGDALLDEAFGPASRTPGSALPLTMGDIVAARELVTRLSVEADRLAGEEDGLAVIHGIAGRAGPAAARPLTAAGRRAVARARACLAARPEAEVGMADVAAAADCSAFHLARLFRRATGTTIHGYRTGLRLALAIERVAEGERDLAGLAAELGFTHHSHMTATFRRHVGVTPRALRARFAGPGRILTAAPTVTR